MRKELKSIIEKHFTVGSHKAETIVDEIISEINKGRESPCAGTEIKIEIGSYKKAMEEIRRLEAEHRAENIVRKIAMCRFEKLIKEEVESPVFWICNRNFPITVESHMKPYKKAFKRGYVYREREDGEIVDFTGRFSTAPKNHNFTKIKAGAPPVVGEYILTHADKQIIDGEKYIGMLFEKSLMDKYLELFPDCKFAKIKKIIEP